MDWEDKRLGNVTQLLHRNKGPLELVVLCLKRDRRVSLCSFLLYK